MLYKRETANPSDPTFVAILTFARKSGRRASCLVPLTVSAVTPACQPHILLVLLHWRALKRMHSTHNAHILLSSLTIKVNPLRSLRKSTYARSSVNSISGVAPSSVRRLVSLVGLHPSLSSSSSHFPSPPIVLVIEFSFSFSTRRSRHRVLIFVAEAPVTAPARSGVGAPETAPVSG